MSFTLTAEPPPLAEDESGAIRVAGTRVLLEMVVRAYQRGMTAEQIAEWYDVLELADVYGVLRYYLRHKDEVDAYVARCEAEAREIRRKIEERQGPQPSREELIARLNAQRGE
jgi:uncharacterized protein (DUF433 family)